MKIEGMQIDHIDRDVNNNTRENLRLATCGQNRSNSQSHNKTGFKGVQLRGKLWPRWSAQITVNRKKVWLGDFDTPEQAHAAYMEAAKKYQGEFACPACAPSY